VPGNYNLGTAKGTIELDASSLGRATASLDYFGRRLIAVGAIGVGAFGFAVKSAADFEEQMSRFKAVTDTPTKAMDAMRQKALQLGRDSAYGATEVAQGFVELGKAGLSAQDILAGVGDAAVYLAAAGELDMADSTNILVTALRTFKLPATDAVHVANLLAGAANASLSEVSDLAESFRYAGPVAATAGVSVEDLATSLALFSNVGIKGSQAGTSFRSMLLGLVAYTPKARAELQKLGIITADGTNTFLDSTGKLKPLGQVFQILSDHTKNLSSAERISSLNAIFQRRALTAAAEAAVQGGKGFEYMQKQIERTTAKKVMETKLDNLKGSLKILKASLETFAITIGERFQPAIKAGADFLRDLTNHFAKLSPKVQSIIGWVAAAGGGFFILAGGLLLAASSGIKAYRAARDVGAAIKILGHIAASPVNALRRLTGALLGLEGAASLGELLLLIGVILAVAAAAYFLWTRWKQVWEFIKNNKAIAAVIALFFPFIAIFVAIVGGLKYLADHWSTIWPKIKAVAKAVVDWFVHAWQDAEKWVKEAVDNIISFFERLPGRISKWVSEAIQNVIGFFERLPGQISEALHSAGDAIYQFTQHLPETLATLAGDAIHWLVTTGIAVITGLVNGFVQALPAITAFLLGLPAKILGILGDIGSWLLGPGLQMMIGLFNGMVQGATAALVWIVTVLVPSLIHWADGAVGWLVQAGLDLLNGFWNAMLSVYQGIMNWLGGFAGSIVAAVGDLGSSLLGTGLAAIQGLWDGMVEIAGSMMGWLEQLPGLIIGAIGDLGATLLSTGERAITGLWNGMKAIADDMISWAKGVAGDILDAFSSILGIGSPAREMHKLGDFAMQGLYNGLKQSSGAVLALMSDVARSMQGEMSGQLMPIAASGGGVGGSSNVDNTRNYTFHVSAVKADLNEKKLYQVFRQGENLSTMREG
jgi:TP901 family phage tail tape measure protein